MNATQHPYTRISHTPRTNRYHSSDTHGWWGAHALGGTLYYYKRMLVNTKTTRRTCLCRCSGWCDTLLIKRPFSAKMRVSYSILFQAFLYNRSRATPTTKTVKFSENAVCNTLLQHGKLKRQSFSNYDKNTEIGKAILDKVDEACPNFLCFLNRQCHAR